MIGYRVPPLFASFGGKPITQTFLRGGSSASPVFQSNSGTSGVLVRDAATSGSTAETLTIPTTSLLTPSAGTVVIETYVNGNNTSATPTVQRSLFTMSAASDRIEIRRTTGGVFQAITGNTGGTSVATWTNTPTAGVHRYCLAYDATDIVLAADGSDRGTAATPKMPTAIQPTMYINSDQNGGQQWNSPTQRVYLYARKLSAAERAAATLGNYPSDFTVMLSYVSGTLGSVTRGTNNIYDPSLIAPAANTFG